MTFAAYARYRGRADNAVRARYLGVRSLAAGPAEPADGAE
jgi:hypothetical protein